MYKALLSWKPSSQFPRILYSEWTSDFLVAKIRLSLGKLETKYSNSSASQVYIRWSAVGRIELVASLKIYNKCFELFWGMRMMCVSTHNWHFSEYSFGSFFLLFIPITYISLLHAWFCNCGFSFYHAPVSTNFSIRMKKSDQKKMYNRLSCYIWK